jgi:valyl-tRNA synthetase
MSLPKKYTPKDAEQQLVEQWHETGVYQFMAGDDRPVYSIDTPPPTVSGKLHLGHTYSYTHADIFARYQRMRGKNVFYPMGYDDNGLPTERLVEQQLGIKAADIGRQAFIEQCLQFSKKAEQDYQDLWQRMGLSIDWRYTYRTIDECSRRTSQLSFIDLYRRGYIYRTEAPGIWCPECQTAIAQADVDDIERTSNLITAAFTLENGEVLPIATTRPELLPACVAVFIHPNDKRYQHLAGEQILVPLFNRRVNILQDRFADPEKGTGAVMCCTFGDNTDKYWWHTYQLDQIQCIDRQGKLTEAAGEFAGMKVAEARAAIQIRLEEEGYLLDIQPITQTIPVHERCDTPVELIMSQQWFVRLLEFKSELLAAGEEIAWHPAHMKNRYRSWVENLAWDWCISRQRYYGIPFPLWYCQDCGEILLADESQLPVDPIQEDPLQPCQCGSANFSPDQDIFDTWATSSLSPQIAGKLYCDQESAGNELYPQVSPFSMRPQAHDIIRAWAFYTIAKSHYHYGQIPWKDIVISGWGIAGEGKGKISKSRGGGPLPPLEMIDRHSADAVRYWAASTGLGKDTIISEEKIQLGAKLVTKLYNVARFSQKFLEINPTETSDSSIDVLKLLSPADRWILSRMQRLIERTTALMENYDYAAAKGEIEAFFWQEFTDNYLEMSKQRLYGDDEDQKQAARFSLYQLLITIIKLFAPFLPFITETIYQGLFISGLPEGSQQFESIHLSSWPTIDPNLQDEAAEQIGRYLVEIAVSVRRFKSQRGLPLNYELEQLYIAHRDQQVASQIKRAAVDLASITRAREIIIENELNASAEILLETAELRCGIKHGINFKT